MNTFLSSYIECALWSSTDEADVPLDSTYYPTDIAPVTQDQMAADCAAFQEENAMLLEGIDPTQAGHDFWLTRNRHGAGFWDRGLGEIGKQLTEAAHSCGSFDLYVGDDGQIHGN